MRTKNPETHIKRAKLTVKDGPPIVTFNSMAACTAATGIPGTLLRTASKAGCTAFVGGRVTLGPLLRWIFKQDNESGTNWSDALKEAQAKRERLRLAKDENKLVDRGDVKDGIAKCVSALLGEIDRRFTCELPPALKGLDEMAIRNRCVAEISQMRKAMIQRFDSIGENEGEENAGTEATKGT